MNNKKCSCFWSYVRQYRFCAGMFFLFSLVFLLVFSLYDLEWEAVIYAACLCLLITAAVLGIHYVSYWKHHKEYEKILCNLPLLPEELPKAATLTEQDLQELATGLRKILDARENQWQHENQKSMEYYTTWVHQIKTPISVMRMILQSEDTEEHRELAAQLFSIEQYVEMVLGYLRLESTSTDFVFQNCDLDGMIRQAIRKYAPLFVRKRIRLVYEPVNMEVLTDEKWFLFILQQVLSNAVKYTAQGSITITAGADKILRIKDTGIGIAKEDLPRIFDHGFTGYNGRTHKKATGLGLYLCRLTANRLSHKIAVTSEIGKGTEVSIDFNTIKLDCE